MDIFWNLTYGKMTCQVFLSLKQLLQCKKSDLCNACANNNNKKKKKLDKHLRMKTSESNNEQHFDILITAFVKLKMSSAMILVNEII